MHSEQGWCVARKMVSAAGRRCASGTVWKNPLMVEISPCAVGVLAVCTCTSKWKQSKARGLGYSKEKILAWNSSQLDAASGAALSLVPQLRLEDRRCVTYLLCRA